MEIEKKRIEFHVNLYGSFFSHPTKSLAYWLGKHSKNFINHIGFRKNFSPLARPKGTPNLTKINKERKKSLKKNRFSFKGGGSFLLQKNNIYL
jgi:hypothetical protein